MTTLREAAQQALEALYINYRGAEEAARILKAALAEPEKLPIVEIETVLTVQEEPACCCGEPTAGGVVHRRDGPCYMAEPVQEQPTCDECGKHKRDGWALYCVGCVEPMFSDAAEPAGVPVGGHSAASTNTKLEEQAYRTCPKCSHPMFCAVKCDQCGRVFEDEAEAESITDAMMNLVDRLGSEADQVDPRAWHHLLVYAPKQKPSQEPVGWFGYDNSIGTWFETNEGDDDSVLLYTVPPQRKPLTDEEIADIYIKWDAKPGVSMADFARAIERAHGIGEQE